MRVAIAIVAALVAAVLGGYVGLFALLSLTGLRQPSWAPVAMLTGAALVGSLTASLIAELSASTVVRLTATATTVGALVGLLILPMNDGLEWMIVSGVVLVSVVAIVAWRLEASSA